MPFAAPPPREDESIFAAPEVSDDLFNDGPKLPVVEVPKDAAWPGLQVGGPTFPEPSPPPPPPMEATAAAPPVTQGTTVAYVPPEPAAPGAGDAAAATEVIPLPPGEQWPGTGETGREGGTALDSFPPPVPRPPARPPGGGLLMAIVLIFLVPYSIFATAAAIYFYYIKQNAPSPLENLPDFPAENPGVTRKSQSFVYPRVPPDRNLPAKLRVPLGSSIRVGDLEVMPVKVEQRPVEFHSEDKGVRPSPSRADALVLTLRLRNVSADERFVPTDPAFIRLWRQGHDPDTSKPYTLLEVGAKRFYGGACKWAPRPANLPGRRFEGDPREYIRGQENLNTVLEPGGQTETVVSTDPDNPDVVKAVRRFPGTLLWRVQVRRGLVKVRDRQVSATAVIGVEFTAHDIAN
jgi:hypothetical protein